MKHQQQQPNKLCTCSCILLALLLVFNNTFIVDARTTTTNRIIITPISGHGNRMVSRKDDGKRRQRQRQYQKSKSNTLLSLYQWGNLGNNQKIKETNQQKLIRLLKFSHRSITQKIDLDKRLEQLKNQFTFQKILNLSLRAFRTWIFYFFSSDCFDSIYEDRWHSERDPDDFFGGGGMWISKVGHKEVVRRRMQRGKRNRQWVGLGYTPRLVWLVGVLLKGTFACTSIEKVFNPSITSWGAGTVLGAKCTHQEWISAFMLGWYGSEYYWKLLFGCAGPPSTAGGFEGIPISISKIRLFGKVPAKKEKWYCQ